MSSPARPVQSVAAAFTLVEMLVVISVIAILTAVSVTAIGSIRESSKLTQCSSNLMQIGQAIQGYTNDWNGFLPTISQITGKEGGFAHYFGNSLGVQSTTTAKCPKIWDFYTRYPGNSSSSPNIGSSGWDISAMYGASDSLPFAASNRAGNFNVLLKVNQIIAKSLCALVFDGDAQWNGSQGVQSTYGPQFMHSSTSKSRSYTMVLGNPVVRDGRSNTLFADGSVRALTYGSTAGNYDEFKTMMCVSPSAISAQSAAVRKKYQTFWNYVGDGGDPTVKPSGWAP